MRLLESVRADVDCFAAKIQAPDHLLPTHGESEDFARPHIDVAEDGLMAWVVFERGEELERRSTYDRRELLYWVFAAVTFWVAADHEAAHGNDAEDHAGFSSRVNSNCCAPSNRDGRRGELVSSALYSQDRMLPYRDLRYLAVRLSRAQGARVAKTRRGRRVVGCCVAAAR